MMNLLSPLLARPAAPQRTAAWWRAPLACVVLGALAGCGGAPGDGDVSGGQGLGGPLDSGVSVGVGGDSGQSDAGPSGGSAEADAGVPGGSDGGVGEPRVARVAFQSRRDGHYDVRGVAVDGGTSEPLAAREGSNELFPAWSPDGQWLAFASDREGPYGLYLRNVRTGVEGRVEARLADGTALFSATAPGFSPDGTSLVFEGRASATANADIYRVVLVEGRAEGAVQALTTDAARDVGPVWGADGSVYFVSNRGTGVFELWAMAADGSGQRALSSGAQVRGRPAVSPGGDRVAYARQSGGRSQVVVHAIASNDLGQPVLGEARTLSAEDDSEPAFSPDGRRVAVSSLRDLQGVESEVLVLDVESGAVVARLTQDDFPDGAPAFAPPVRP